MKLTEDQAQELMEMLAAREAIVREGGATTIHGRITACIPEFPEASLEALADAVVLTGLDQIMSGLLPVEAVLVTAYVCGVELGRELERRPA